MNSNKKGAISLLTSTILYGLYGVFYRLIGGQFSVISQNIVRGFIVSILAFLVIKRKNIWKKIKKSDMKWVLLWLLGSAPVPFISFLVFNNMPIGTGYFTYYAGIILGGFLVGSLVFSEKITKEKTIAVFLSMLGIVTIFKASISLQINTYLFLGVLGGGLTGMWNTLSKKISGNYSDYQLVLLDNLTAFVVSSIALIVFQEALPPIQFSGPWVAIIAFSIIGLINTRLIIYGFKNLEVQVGTLIIPIEVVFGSLFGYLFFKEVLPTSIILGGALIVSGMIIPEIWRSDSRKITTSK